jgi:putative methyltransferase (TIGR04325 family)
MTELLSPSNWLPPILERALRRISPRALRLAGPYPDWSAASRAASGYDAEAILERIASAQRAVRNGEACYERDGVLFDTPDFEFSLVALLQRAAADNRGKLTVLDFGGSLGTSYIRNRALLDNIDTLLWQVVEQPHFVELGKREFEDRALKFEDSIAECQPPDVVLLRSVLQYLPEPHALVEELATLSPTWIFVDRTPFTRSGEEAVMLQKVPAKVYRASYPAWVLSWDKLCAQLATHYSLVCEIPSAENDAGSGRFRADYRGGIFRRQA